MPLSATPSQDLAADRRSLTQVAFDRVRDEVIRGELRPGARLRVQSLSSRYGIGATAIREALSRLITDGLVQLEEHRGFLVAPVSRNDLSDLTEARIALEQRVLRRAIERGDTAWEADVSGRLHRLSACPPSATPEAGVVWGLLHRHFHEALLASCGSRWLIALCSLLHEKSERYRWLADIGMTVRTSRSGDEHTALTVAVLARDSATACGLLAAHYRETTEIIFQAEACAALFDVSVPARGRTRFPA